MLFRLSMALAGVGMLAGCAASGPSYVASADTPLPGARSPSPDGSTKAHTNGPSAFNSDNRPVFTRSGINSDPDNPSGMPGPSNAGG